MSTLVFNEEKHTYEVDGKRIPSVTGIIKEVLGSGFEYLSAEDSEFYKMRGHAVHLCAAYEAQKLQYKHDPQIDGHVAAIKKFFAELRPEVICVEKQMASRLYKFAGTLDMAGKIGATLAVFDYKQTVEPVRLRLQLGAYSVLLEENMSKTINHGFGVTFLDDGRYIMTKPFDMRRARNEFLAIATTYRIKKELTKGKDNE